MLAAFYAWPAFYDFAYFGGVFCLNHEANPNFHRNEPTLKLSLALFTKDFALISLTVISVTLLHFLICARFSKSTGPLEEPLEEPLFKTCFLHFNFGTKVKSSKNKSSKIGMFQHKTRS